MKTFILLSLFIFHSCVSQNESNNQTISTNMGAQNEGFTEMTIVESRNNSCEFLLQDKDSNLYEVQDISKKIPSIKIGKKIEIKFTSLRKMSVCGAQPITIDAIDSKE